MSDRLTEREQDLRATAQKVLSEHRSKTDADSGTACALRTATNDVFTGIYVETTIGTAAVHAEAAAIASAVKHDSLPIETIVAVSHPGENDSDATPAVISPCGTCRELIYDYGPEATVIVFDENGPQTRSISTLLPDTPWFDAWDS